VQPNARRLGEEGGTLYSMTNPIKSVISASQAPARECKKKKSVESRGVYRNSDLKIQRGCAHGKRVSPSPGKRSDRPSTSEQRRRRYLENYNQTELKKKGHSVVASPREWSQKRGKTTSLMAACGRTGGINQPLCHAASRASKEEQ